MALLRKDNSIVLYTADGTLTLLAEDFAALYPSARPDMEWSPDGRYLAAHGLEGIMLIDAVGARVIPVVVLATRLRSLSLLGWSEDGRSIVFETSSEPG